MNQNNTYTESERAELYYDRQSLIMAGTAAMKELVDYELSDPANTEELNNFLLERRKVIQKEMEDLVNLNLQYLEKIKLPKVMLSFSHEYTNAQGQTVRIEVKPTWREKIYNNVNKILRRVLLGE